MSVISSFLDLWRNAPRRDSPQNENMDEQDPLDVLRRTVEKIDQAATEQENRSKQLRKSHGAVSFAAAILGVGAPTLVAYFAQSPNVGTYLKLFAIIFAALAGATTVLLNTFRWGERYGQASLAAISLRELASSTRLLLYDLKQAADSASGYDKEELKRANRNSQQQMFDILRSVVQNEAAIFSKNPPSQPTEPLLKGSKKPRGRSNS